MVVVVVLRILPALDYLEIPHPRILYSLRLLGSKMSSLFCVVFSCNLCPKLRLVCSCLLSSVCSLIEVSASIPDPCALAVSGAVPNSNSLVLLLPVLLLYVVVNDKFARLFDFVVLKCFLSCVCPKFCFVAL